MGSVLTTPIKKENSEATCRVAQVFLLPAEYKGMINVRRGEKTHAVKDFLFQHGFEQEIFFIFMQKVNKIEWEKGPKRFHMLENG